MFLLFGGVDRQQEHFHDLLMGYIDKSKLVTKIVECQGDIPNPRSGHSMVSYGPYVFLFGGIDFMEEEVYNDLYILDTRSWIWNYVGESGHEIIGRNSHSMSILCDSGKSVLVIFGGASPEHGPLRDTVYAALPSISDIDPTTIAIHWNSLIVEDTTESPSPMEMQSSCTLANKLLVTGGRDINGNILKDSWVLSVSFSSTEEGQQSSELPRLNWKNAQSLQLPSAACAHTSFIQCVDEKLLFFSIGGFSYDGLAGYVHSCELELENDNIARLGSWTTQTLNGKVATRFGHCLTSLPKSFFSCLAVDDKRISKKLSSSAKSRLMANSSSSSASESSEGSSSTSSGLGSVAALIFGGVDIENDYNDLWLVV
jgi:hypothetical protein